MGKDYAVDEELLNTLGFTEEEKAAYRAKADNREPTYEITVKDAPYRGEMQQRNIWKQTKKGKELNEIALAKNLRDLNDITCCHGVLYTPDGLVTDESMLHWITQQFEELDITKNIDKLAKSILATLKNVSQTDYMAVDRNIIPFSNGDMHINLNSGKGWVFMDSEKTLMPYRLSAMYSSIRKPMPLFEKWLHDLFEDEDIPTVQEMFGYMFVPVTTAQEAFFLVGEGGVGKSVLGTILKGILGTAYTSIQTQQLVRDKFQIQRAENKLCIYDDDLSESALSDTSLFKKLITADQPIPAERKFQNPYEFLPYCKVVACANFMLSSLYDDSSGFYRRLHPIVVKKLDKSRKTISNFGQLILEQEREEIVAWALVGLQRLIENNWRVSRSHRTTLYLQSTTDNTSENNFADFLNDVLEVDKSACMSSATLLNTYKKWCKDNGIDLPRNGRLIPWVKQNQGQFAIEYFNKVKIDGKYVRGFKGAKLRETWCGTLVL